jgi:hypothetical protein
MKPIAKQLIGAVFFLALVYVASLGIRQVRLSASQVTSVKNPVIAKTEPNPFPAESDTVDPEPEPQYAEVPEPEEEAPIDDYPKPKSLKGDYTKAKGEGARGLQKISWGENEHLYITAEGETWYVVEGSDGKTTKMRVQIDETTGEISSVESADESGGLQPIPMGDGYNMYVTDEGQTWYVGGRTKSRVEIDDNTGEVTVLEQYGGDDDK